MILYCQQDGNCYQVSHYVCLYYCPKNTKIKCRTYDDNYEVLKELEVEQSYLDKYGVPEYPEPKSRKARKKKKEERPVKQRGRKKVEAVPAAPVEESVVPKKRKRRTKAEMEVEKTPVEVKPKRKRRTKAEMEEARKNETIPKTKRTPKARKV